MTRVLLPLVVAVVGSAGVGFARHNVDLGPGVVAVVAVLALVAASFGERGAALAAIGVGAAASFATPTGLAPLLVVTGVVLAGDIGLVDRRVERWRYVIDALVALPALAGLAGTIAAQPSKRAAAVAATAVACLAVTLWRNRSAVSVHHAASPVSYVAALGAAVVAFAPDRLKVLGDLPHATVVGSRSVTAALGVFVLTMLVDLLWAERAATG